MIFLDVHYIMILFIIEKYLSYTSDFTLPIHCRKSSGGHPITCFFFQYGLVIIMFGYGWIYALYVLPSGYD